MLRLIILGTGNVSFRVIKRCLQNNEIQLIGAIPDVSVNEEILTLYQKNVAELGVPLMQLCEENLKKVDLIFMPEYRQVLPRFLTEKYHFVNCHGGILPYYRGFAANAWAIMNGSDEIGYSFHRVNEKLDDGVIYFVDRIKMSPEETYSDVHERMVESIVEHAPYILQEIYQGKRKGVQQEGKRIYCNRFSPKMGNITNFDVDAQYILRLHKCMAKPLGTGLYFNYKGKRYNINKLDLGQNRDIDNYIGIPGKVVNIENNELWIKTKDNVVIITELTNENGETIRVDEHFKNGNQLMN